MLDAAFLYNPPGCGLHCHAGSLLLTEAGHLLASWYAYPDVEHVGATIVVARKPRQTDKWLPSATAFGPAGYSAGNPVLFEEAPDRLWLFFVLLKGHYWNDAVIHGAHSGDEGQSWSRPAELIASRGLMVRHPPVRRADGMWLLPAYDEQLHRSLVLASRPPFTEWLEVVRFDDVHLIQPALVREEQRLTLLFRPASDPRVIWRSHSTDEGGHWSQPVRTSLPTPLSGLSAASNGGRLACAYNHTHSHERRPLTLALSEDGGRVWSEPRRIDDMAGELSYPSFVSSADGTLHGLYTYNRRLIKYVQLDARWVG